MVNPSFWLIIPNDLGYGGKLVYLEKHTSMKNFLILIFLFPLFSYSQNDTIFTKEGKVIVGQITLINDQNVFYMNKKGYEETVHLSKTNYYVKGGIKSIVNYVDNSNQITILNSTDTVNLTQEINYMRNCLLKSYNQFKIGAISFCSGIAVSGIGVALISKQSQLSLPLYGLGGLVSIIGAAIMIDSHKWIGKAGLGMSGKGDSVTIYYRFK